MNIGFTSPFCFPGLLQGWDLYAMMTPVSSLLVSVSGVLQSVHGWHLPPRTHTHTS